MITIPEGKTLYIGGCRYKSTVPDRLKAHVPKAWLPTKQAAPAKPATNKPSE